MRTRGLDRGGSGWRGWPWPVALTVALAVTAAGTRSASPATLTVTNTADGGAGSLRDAVALAGNGDVIDFDLPGCPCTITLTGGQLEIVNKALTISGPGADQLTISGNNASRVLYLEGGGAAVTVTGLTIADGSSTLGGGIFVWAGVLTLDRSMVRGNSSTGYGGGIAVTGGRLTVNDSTIADNSSSINGGGIFQSAGTVVVRDSVIAANVAVGGGGGVATAGNTMNVTTVIDSVVAQNSANAGGGLHVNGTRLTVQGSTIADNSTRTLQGGGILIASGSAPARLGTSTVSGNFAVGNGGGIFNQGTLDVRNSTLSGNATNASGGGISDLGGVLTVVNSTIARNRANADDVPAGVGGGAGGGIHASGTETLRNSIVAGNVLGTVAPVPHDIVGTIETAQYNLIGNAATAGGLVHGVHGNIVGNGGAGTLEVATVLSPALADNGGPTYTHALQPDGPAVDAGSDALAVGTDGGPLATDQRGPGFARVVGAAVDLGAFEVQAVDTDGDGVLDVSDNCPATPNPDQADHDGDGYGDACDADDDGDGVEDVADNCPFTANLDQADADGDGLGDACDADLDGDGIENAADNCPLDPNPEQADTDADGAGDACDGDDDGDGIEDRADNCPVTANPDQADLDGDGIGDACDADLDGDGIENAADNCPLAANPGQDDTDGDGAGDACDADDDGDGVEDGSDNCPVIVNADQADTDGDGRGDACDADLDGDGIENALDNCPTIANTAQHDFDGDGAGDACDADLDDDRVGNAADLCPFTPPGEVVEPATGCAIAQLVPCSGPMGTTAAWKSHGQYVSRVARTARRFVTLGLITKAERATILAEARESDCGR